MRKLPSFFEARKANWQFLRAALDGLGDYFDFQVPTHAAGWSEDGFVWDKSRHTSDPSWFGFLLLVKPDAPFTRTELARHLDERRIGNRMLFGGNLVRQPAFVQLRKDNPASMRAIGDMNGADRIMNDALFVGVYPGLTTSMVEYASDVIRVFCLR